MKKLLLIFLSLTFFFSYSQSKEEMLDAGIKKGTVNRIFKKFDGDINAAIERWSETGSGKLSKKFTKSAEKLGFDKDYLTAKLKQARTVRAQMIAAGVAGAAAGYAASQGGSTTSSESSTPYYNSTTPGYSSNSTKSYSSGTTSTTMDVQPIYGGTDIYQNNEYGIQEKTGEMRNNYTGGVDIYQKNEYGIQEKTGEMRNNYTGGVDVYKKNQYGIQEKKRKKQK